MKKLWMRFSMDALSLIILIGLLYACASELPVAMDKEHQNQEDRIMQRCVIHGDYNMADALCAAAAKEKGE